MTETLYAVINLEDEHSLVSYHATLESAKARAEEDFNEHPCSPAVVRARRDGRGIARENRHDIIWRHPDAEPSWHYCHGTKATGSRADCRACNS